ncbi:hypothetical protein [Haloferax volcanii]|uniref:Uncharacterized protein n=2 Tax=Haloferax volcanii TaxID=2246 RepID=D4GR24_HALVD|nr:hypothetical protein [Haloferax volcanii]ADE01654.2 uncharacterized protein HVO_A0350 [Haloferax volcanii DS2]MBS8121366.1 hypothetical protein [Haloferax volcanii]MBS8126374.1 hypothetical protein [Haloferax volcanii]MBS8130242.1 hypothetical protein [Haloferax volcanii]MBS8134108.1 hypothetical protein [Haloferax volcanii]
MTRNIDRKSIDLSNINRRRFVQGVSSTVGVSGLGVSGLGKASAEGAREYIGVSYDTRTHITQRKCTASLNYKPDGRLSGILKIAGYNIPVGSDGRIKPNSSSDMWSYWIEKEEEKFQEDDQKLQIRLNFDGDRMVGWMTRPTPKFAKLSFSMNAVDRGATMDKIESALNPKDLSKFDKNPTIPQKGIPTETSIQNMRVKPDKSENYLKKRGGE